MAAIFARWVWDSIRSAENLADAMHVLSRVGLPITDETMETLLGHAAVMVDEKSLLAFTDLTMRRLRFRSPRAIDFIVSVIAGGREGVGIAARLRVWERVKGVADIVNHPRLREALIRPGWEGDPVQDAIRADANEHTIDLFLNKAFWDLMSVNPLRGLEVLRTIKPSILRLKEANLASIQGTLWEKTRESGSAICLRKYLEVATCGGRVPDLSGEDWDFVRGIIRCARFPESLCRLVIKARDIVKYADWLVEFFVPKTWVSLQHHWLLSAVSRVDPVRIVDEIIPLFMNHVLSDRKRTELVFVVTPTLDRVFRLVPDRRCHWMQEVIVHLLHQRQVSHAIRLWGVCNAETARECFPLLHRSIFHSIEEFAEEWEELVDAVQSQYVDRKLKGLRVVPDGNCSDTAALVLTCPWIEGFRATLLACILEQEWEFGLGVVEHIWATSPPTAIRALAMVPDQITSVPDALWVKVWDYLRSQCFYPGQVVEVRGNVDYVIKRLPRGMFLTALSGRTAWEEIIPVSAPGLDDDIDNIFCVTRLWTTALNRGCGPRGAYSQ